LQEFRSYRMKRRHIPASILHSPILQYSILQYSNTPFSNTPYSNSPVLQYQYSQLRNHSQARSQEFKEAEEILFL
jgi:hypothetical protein